MPELSIIIPCYNDASSLQALLPRLRERFADAELLVVNDGSTDDTSETCKAAGAREVRHRYNMGNGAAVKTGARHARGEVLVFMDADGQHDPDEIPALLARLDSGYDMVVGARSARSQASFGRRLANGAYNRIASLITGQQVLDLTSGFRAVRAAHFREFLPLLPNGFSYPTTITMAFFRAGYAVGYHPIEAAQREGRSHINPLRDGVRFLLIIFKVATLYSPLKIFFPSAALVLMAGVFYYGWTFFTQGRFTNATTVLIIAGILIFLLGLISEQITTLLYSTTRREVPDPAGREDEPQAR